MIKKLLCSISLTLLSTVALAQSPNISGHYQCKGSDPFAKVDYSASLIVKQTNETYQFMWDLGKFGKYEGTGFFTAGVDNFIPITVISLSKTPDPENPHNSELQTYKIGQDGTLSGQWTFFGKSKVSPVEVCTKSDK